MLNTDKDIMGDYKVTNDWVPITHITSIGLNNENGLLWKLEVCRYTDETRKSIRGMPIGFIDGAGFHTNPNDKEKKYMMKFTSDGYCMFFERELK